MNDVPRNRKERRALTRHLSLSHKDLRPRDAERREDIKHGVCRECSKRRILWMPAALCERCLLQMAAAMKEVDSQTALKEEAET